MGVTAEKAAEIVLAGPIGHKGQRYEQLQLGQEGVDSCNRATRRTLTMDKLVQLFSPLAKHILRKSKALEKVYNDTVRHAELAKQLLDCTNLEMERAIISEMEKLEVSDGWLAFADKIDQHAYIQAASFSDT